MTPTSEPQHQSIIDAPGIYAGWPANYGIWRDGATIRTGCFIGGYDGGGNKFHPWDYHDEEARSIQLATRNEGHTWTMEEGPTTAPCREYMTQQDKVWKDRVIGLRAGAGAPEPCFREIDWTQTGTRMLFSRTGFNRRPRSWWYLSEDGGASWSLPYAIPRTAQTNTGLAARTDYAVDSRRNELVTGLTCQKQNGDEGRTLLVRTNGREWKPIAWIGQTYKNDDSSRYSIMASTVLLGERHREGKRTYDALMAIRINGSTKRQARQHHIGIYQVNSASGDADLIETFETGAGGNPPSLTRTSTGRNILTYVHRGDRAKQGARLMTIELSDHGQPEPAESEPRVLREATPGAYDCGYVRTTETLGGGMLAVYYWDPGTHDRRTIETTQWKP